MSIGLNVAVHVSQTMLSVSLDFILFVELLFVFVEAVFVAPRSEELGIATESNFHKIKSNGFKGVPAVYKTHLPRPETILWTNKYRKNCEVKGHLSAIIFPAFSTVWQFVNGR